MLKIKKNDFNKSVFVSSICLTCLTLLLFFHHCAVSGLLMETIIYLQSSRNVADPVSGLAHSADTVGDGSPAQSVANPPLSGVVASGSSAGGMSPVPSTSSTTSEAAANIRASVDGSQSSSGITVSTSRHCQRT